MTPLKLPIWGFIYRRASVNTLVEIIRHLSKVKFNSKRNSFGFDHVFQHIKKISNYIFNAIDEGILCRIFTLTFLAKA